MRYYQFPAGWQPAQTGTGESGSWQPARIWRDLRWYDAGLEQTGASSATVCNLCIADDPIVKDVKLRVGIAWVDGNICQGGGVLWRYQDTDNYYAAGADTLAGNFCLYRVDAGKFIRLASCQMPTMYPRHEITVRHCGNRIECCLDETMRLEAIDEAISTEGRVGLWTEADAHTQFERLKLTNLQP
jgi:hypothetical protein